MIEFQKRVLKNGLRVILAPMENTEAATFLVLAGVGSRFEQKKTSGISHFLEHLFFKGTKSRPKAGQVHGDLDRIGASHNAFTSKEETGFWVKSAGKDFDVGIDIVSDILLEPLFKNEEIEKEKGVILQEISMYEDEPRRKVWDVLENVLYGEQPLGWSIAGTKESVGGISRKDIVEYKNKNYLAGNMVVVAAGEIGDAEICLKKIEKKFAKIKAGENKAPAKIRIAQKDARVKIVKKDLDQAHLAMGLHAYDMFDERRHALNLLGVILGGNFSSRLFTEIREKLGLAYYVYAAGDQYTDCGILGLAAGVSRDNLGKTARKIVEIFSVFRSKKIPEEELKNAKSFLRGQTALNLETSDEIASFLAGQELFYKKILQPEEILKKIEKISRNDILKTAKDVFIAPKISMAVMGPLDGEEKQEIFYKNLLKKI